jgi:hypothetical protein
MMKRIRALAVVTTAATAAVIASQLAGGSSPARAGSAGPPFRPHQFVRYVSNPWFPLKPGSLWVYRGVKDGVGQRDVVRVRRRTRTILGITATVVSDVATHNGRVLERTEDWYAQDRDGNVWYLGENTAAFEDGSIDRSGSWQAGRHGAEAGIIMTAQPQVGDTHRQEYWRGQAEDQYWLVDLGQRADVPYGSFRHAALTLEWSRLEPGVIDRKLYVHGIGVVQELAAQGPPERAALVRFRHP